MRDAKARMVAMLKGLARHMDRVEDETGAYRAVYLGSAWALDPCGRYHTPIVPHGITEECVEYWEGLEEAAEELGGWIQAGEDPTDVFFCLPEED